MKRQLLPLQSAVPRKGSRWVKKSSPGKHKASESLSLLALLRDRLSLVESARQAKKLLQDGMVLLDGLKVTIGCGRRFGRVADRHRQKDQESGEQGADRMHHYFFVL